MRRLTIGVVLRVLERVLPHSVASAVVGDLAEEAPSHSVGWLLSQATRTLWFVYAPTWRELSSGWALPAGGATLLIVLVAAQSLWRVVLSAVPRRAGHLPGAGWTFGVLLCAAVAAWIVTHAVARSVRRSANA
jgi:hypothetical protein